MSIASNLHDVRTELEAACARAGRSADEVQLMAVSKMHPVAALEEAYAAGQRLFGENRVQEMQEKATRLTTLQDVDVHLIGPLQNNKTARAAQLFNAVDTVDSHKTAMRLDATAATLGRVLPILIEVKLSPEPEKHGIPPEELGALLQSLAGLEHVQVQGLMTVAPLFSEGEAARPFFRQLRKLRDQYQRDLPSLRELSMGMSGDFRTAIEEGSTVVRIGTAIFGKRERA